MHVHVYTNIYDTFSAMSMAIPLMLDSIFIQWTCHYIFFIQISMNVTQTMEAVHRSVPTHQDHECVAADVDTALLVITEPAQVSLAVLR